LLAACATTPLPAESPKAQNPQQARVFVMRDPEIQSELVHPAVKVDDESVGDVAPAKFLVVDRPPGQHVVSVSFMQGYYPVTLTTRAGSVHYVHIAMRPYMERLLVGGVVPQAIEQASTGHSGPFTLIVMNDAEGRALLHKLMAGGEFTEPAPRD
ncbi:MAG TPA: DUF2846 domain-containing protein, partial [Xanthobacteraceae bacterium]|nr:DUF2846 domain-containing protein [Xanthobacteraceae bacterium]